MRSCLILDIAAGGDVSAALACGADAVLLRRAGETENARTFVADARRVSESLKVFVEITPIEAESVESELDSLVGFAPDGVFLPACADRTSLSQLAMKLAVREAEAGLPHGETKIAAFVGANASAILGLPAFAGATKRLAAIAFDEAPLRASLGLAEPDAAPIATARSLVVLAAAAAGVPALLGPIRPEDADAYVTARRDGFAGALALAAGQIEPIHAVFPARRVDKRPFSAA